MMLIKTSDPCRQIEKMLQKSEQRRRLARRQDRHPDAMQAIAAAISTVTGVMQGMTAPAEHGITRNPMPRSSSPDRALLPVVPRMMPKTRFV